LESSASTRKLTPIGPTAIRLLFMPERVDRGRPGGA
jgi:hypothetical protein